MTNIVLAIDVDGVLNRLSSIDKSVANTWESRSIEVLTKDVPKSPFHRQQDEDILDMPVIVNPFLHAPWLASLHEQGVEIVWASTWEAQANICFAPFYDLGEWPVACSTNIVKPRFSENTPSWKARCLHQYAGDRPLIWLDDMNWEYAQLSEYSEQDNAEEIAAYNDPTNTGFKPEGGPWIETFWGTQFKHVAIEVDPERGLERDIMHEVDRLVNLWNV